MKNFLHPNFLQCDHRTCHVPLLWYTLIDEAAKTNKIPKLRSQYTLGKGITAQGRKATAKEQKQKQINYPPQAKLGMVVLVKINFNPSANG